MSINVFKSLRALKKESTAVSATPLKAPDNYEVVFDSATTNAMSQADAAAQYAAMYNSLSSATSSTGVTSMYATSAGSGYYPGSGYSGPAHVTFGPTTTTHWDIPSRNVSEQEFKQLQVHVIELTELVGELLEEVRYLRSGKAA
jgi:hypothetical protein